MEQEYAKMIREYERDVADNFMVGKSTVWLDFTKRLKHIDRVHWLLSYNKRHSVEKMNAARNNRR